LINLMLDLDPSNRIDIHRVLAHEWFDEHDACNELFFAEMRSRPIEKGNNIVIPFGKLVKTLDEAKYVLMRAIPMSPTDEPYHIEHLQDEIHIGRDEDDNVLFRVVFDKTLKCTLKWKNGDLKGWIHFHLCVKEALGYDTGAREIARAKQEMAN